MAGPAKKRRRSATILNLIQIKKHHRIVIFRHNVIDRSNEIDVLTAIGAAGATHFVERDGDRDRELNPGARWRQVDCKMRAFITRSA
jgi:hypothetical protein